MSDSKMRMCTKYTVLWALSSKQFIGSVKSFSVSRLLAAAIKFGARTLPRTSRSSYGSLVETLNNGRGYDALAMVTARL